jgi:hypothetical protein
VKNESCRDCFEAGSKTLCQNNAFLVPKPWQLKFVILFFFLFKKLPHYALEAFDLTTRMLPNGDDSTKLLRQEPFVIWGQSYESDLQRQRCKNLQRHECVWKTKTISFTMKNSLAGVVNVH